MIKINGRKVAIFCAGVLAGTVGVKLLTSKEAKKVYVHCTAAALRAKESILDVVALAQENAEDILAEAKQINDERTAKEAEAEFCENTEG